MRSYGLRLRRKLWRLRAARRAFDLSRHTVRTRSIRPDDILLFATIRNEKPRLPYFLEYYRRLGVGHFLVVDNASDDGTAEYLAQQPDVSLWTTPASYRRSRFGMLWLSWLQRRHAHGHWTLTVDADEFLVFPFCDSRPLRALTDWLDASGIKSFGTLLLDMYPKGPVDAAFCPEGADPFGAAGWFDSGNYAITRNAPYGNLWIQGGPRARAFFSDDPAHAPALNKIPLVKWHRRYTYISSTHALLPRGLNLVYDEWGGEKTTGCLLHAKFLHDFAPKAAVEEMRRQHYAASREYRAYREREGGAVNLWTEWSHRYRDWQQLEELGLMSRGNWA